MAGDVQQEHVVGLAIREEILDPLLDDVRRLVAHYVHLEIADLWIAENPSERLSVRGQRRQVCEPLVLVPVVDDDQRLPHTGHQSPLPAGGVPADGQCLKPRYCGTVAITASTAGSRSRNVAVVLRWLTRSPVKPVARSRVASAKRTVAG